MAPENKSKRGGVAVRGRTTKLRSRLGEELYELVRGDLPTFYSALRGVATCDIDPASREDPPGVSLPRYKTGQLSLKDAWAYRMHCQKVMLQLVKLANADVTVGSAEAEGEAGDLVSAMKEMSTAELARFVESCRDAGGTDDD